MNILKILLPLICGLASAYSYAQQEDSNQKITIKNDGATCGGNGCTCDTTERLWASLPTMCTQKARGYFLTPI